MTTFDPFTPVPSFPIEAMTATERKAMQREADIIRQSRQITRISAAQLGIHTEPTPAQQATSDRKKRIRRRRLRTLAQYAVLAVLAMAAVMVVIGYANLLGIIAGR